MFNSRVFFGTIAAGVLAAGVAVPAMAATPAHSAASPVKSVVGTATMPVGGALPGGLTLPKGVIGGTPAAGALGGLEGVPAISPQLAALVGGASAPGTMKGLPAIDNPVNGTSHHVTGHTNAVSTGTDGPNGVKTSLSGGDASEVLKSLPIVGSLTGSLPAFAPGLAGLAASPRLSPGSGSLTAPLPAS